MLEFFSIVGICLSFCAGFFFPKKAGWATLAAAPLLGAASFTLVPSHLLPLTVDRIAALITLGLFLSKYNSTSSRFSILKSHYFKIVCIFFIWVLFMELGERPTNVIFAQLPKLFYAFFLPYIIIKTKKDLRLFVSILAFQAALIGVIVIFEYCTHIKIGNILMSTSPGYTFDPNAVYLRNGFYRVFGFMANPVYTSVYLIFVFPFTILYGMRGNLIRLFPFLFACIGLIFTQSRITFVAVIFLIIMLFIINTRFKGMLFHFSKKTLLSFSKSLVFGFLIIFLFFPVTFRITKFFIYNTLNSIHCPGFSKSLHNQIENSALKGKENVIISKTSNTIIPDAKHKYIRFPKAFQFFKKKPFFGNGAPNYVYSNLMNHHDIPAFLIYLLSGGVALFALYVLFLLYPIHHLWNHLKLKSLLTTEKRIAAFILTALGINCVIISLCWIEIHYVIMFMIYTAFYKVYYSDFRS